MSATPKVEVTNLKKIENAGSLKALADFKINQSEFYSWRVIQQNGQDAWVSPPQESWESGGKKHYKPLVKLPKELMSLISDAILRNYEEVDK